MRGKESENGMYEFPYMKPPQRSGWETFRSALYDSKNGTILGRNAKSWAQILTFYALFYIVLACLFAICMQAMLSTLNDKEPKWQLDNGLIGKNPGLGFRPIADRTEEGSLIWYNPKNKSSIEKWVKLTEDFLEPYLRNGTGSNKMSCDFDQPAKKGRVCDVDMNKFQSCGPAHSFGYSSTSPCIFLKLNRIINWVPEFYNDINDLPSDMPKQLVDTIKSKKPEERDQIWVTCEGEHPADKEHVSKFEYLPYLGFPGFYYPYTNDKAYLSPLVAVKIVTPKPNVVINIECRAWAKNINYRGGNQQREGSVHFEIMMDA